MAPIEVFQVVKTLLGFAVLLQALELWSLKSLLGPTGIWQWSILRRDFEIFPAVLRKGLDLLWSQSGFKMLILCQISVSAALILLPAKEAAGACACLLFVGTLLVAVRWRGTFNGGADAMTLIVSLSTALGLLFWDRPVVIRGTLWYIALQVTLSFFISGWSKLWLPKWRNGQAMKEFLLLRQYGFSDFCRTIAGNPRLCLLAAWTIIIFECAFPLALWKPEMASPFIGLALVFHLINFYLMGLNRFFWAWLAAYPALWYCSQGMI